MQKHRLNDKLVSFNPLFNPSLKKETDGFVVIIEVSSLLNSDIKSMQR